MQNDVSIEIWTEYFGFRASMFLFMPLIGTIHVLTCYGFWWVCANREFSVLIEL